MTSLILYLKIVLSDTKQNYVHFQLNIQLNLPKFTVCNSKGHIIQQFFLHYQSQIY